jgi:hypothetical protein
VRRTPVDWILSFSVVTGVIGVVVGVFLLAVGAILAGALVIALSVAFLVSVRSWR